MSPLAQPRLCVCNSEESLYNANETISRLPVSYENGFKIQTCNNYIAVIIERTAKYLIRMAVQNLDKMLSKT